MISNKVKGYLLYLTISLVLLSQLGCDMKTHNNVGFRSGTIDNDYIEEPLGKRDEYSTALSTSNELIKIIKSNNLSKLQTYIDDDYKTELTESVLINITQQIRNQVGYQIEYKDMQWGFVKDNLQHLLASVKIVKHEKGELHYIFIFKDNPPYNKIIGLKIESRTGVRPPNEL